MESVKMAPNFFSLQVKEVILKEGAIVAVRHSEDEVLQLTNPITLTEKSNLDWLAELLEAIPSTVQAQYMENLQLDVDIPLDILASQVGLTSQIIMVLRKIMFTAAVEECFEDPVLLEQLLQKQRAHVSAAAQAIMTTDLTAQVLTRLNTLITETIGDIRILSALKEAQNMREAWSRFLRYYKTESKPVVRCGDTEVEYGFHYLGNFSTLVKTPLTHEVYFESMKAMADGGFIVARGPAGTGKTESQKDLANALGLPAIVVGCNEGLEVSHFATGFSIMGSMFLIFDEINRCSSEVIQSLVTNVRQSFNANSRKLCALTLNPGLGEPNYASLDLKPIVEMTVPDYLTIHEVLFARNGFQQYEALGSVLTNVLSWCKESFQNSTPNVCDYGLRAGKKIVDAAGQFGKIKPDLMKDGEVELLLPILYYVLSSPHLGNHDCSRLKEKISSFGGKSIPECVEYLDEASTRVILSESLGNISTSLRESLAYFVFAQKIRHGVLALTPGGKESRNAVIMALSKCASLLGINFLAVHFDETTTAEQLYGDDGLLTSILRTNIESTFPTWIALAGPSTLGSVMLEDLNPALDDNKMLRKIPLNRHARIILFDDTASEWTPASISRVGIVNFAA